MVSVVALERAETARKKRDREVEFADRIAPANSDLPIIMKMCTPEEREALWKLAQSKIVDEKWRGNRTGHKNSKRPSLQMATALSEQHALEGKRKVNFVDKRDGKTYKQKALCTFLATHAVLVGGGRFPTEKKNHASHLCHEMDCVKFDHLVWENSADNNRRERLCRKDRVCVCGLRPSCLFE